MSIIWLISFYFLFNTCVQYQSISWTWYNFLIVRTRQKFGAKYIRVMTSRIIRLNFVSMSICDNQMLIVWTRQKVLPCIIPANRIDTALMYIQFLNKPQPLKQISIIWKRPINQNSSNPNYKPLTFADSLKKLFWYGR